MTRDAERTAGAPSSRRAGRRRFRSSACSSDLAGPIAFERGLQFAARTDARRAERCDRKSGQEGSEEVRHRLNPICWGQKAERTRADPHGRRAARTASAPPGHPARGRSFVAAGLLARGSCLRPAFPRTCDPSGMYGRRLAAYSCGGSSGLGLIARTGFPLSSGQIPKNHDMSTYGQHRAAVNRACSRQPCPLAAAR